MNAKLDQLLEKFAAEFSTLKMSQAFTYNDIMAEFEEIRNYYYLLKKTWRQLLRGKLTEMILSGVVDQTISNSITANINPIIDKLLES
jgi:hypothetical protein